MLHATRSTVPLVALLITLVGGPAALAASSRGKVHSGVPVKTAPKAGKLSGALTQIDLKKRTCVVTEHRDGGQSDKDITLSWSRSLRPQRGGKAVEWKAVRPGMLVTAKYNNGSQHNQLTEFVLAD
jgi:hypothetical protein